MPTYFDPLTIGENTFANRIWMPPLTRARATETGLPVEIMAEYYRQRATAGLIMSEGTYVNSETCGFERAPGIYTGEHAERWKPITKAVHDAGGKIFCQLWHCGRIGSTAILNGQDPVSPSGVNDDLDQLNVHALLANGVYARIAATPSRAMSLQDIQRTIEDYGKAARFAKDAGFDGVEIHAASGYLPHQFLSPTINRREDSYGGSLENRVRFITDIFEAVSQVYDPSQIGVRATPFADYNNTRDPDPEATFAFLAKRLNVLKAGYFHAADQNGWLGRPDLEKIIKTIRPNFDGALVLNGAIGVEQGASLIASGVAQAVAFGRAYISNPDLVERISQGVELSQPRPTGWYATGADGYTDYPAFAA